MYLSLQKIEQRLWPQCQRCYRLQGSAVRSGKATLVYHIVGLRLRVFAPAIAMLLVPIEGEEGGDGGVMLQMVDALARPAELAWDEISRHSQRFAAQIGTPQWFPFKSMGLR
jgi:hypothetical protein